MKFNNIKAFIGLTLVAIIFSIMMGCAPKESTEGEKTVTYAQNQDPVTLDPHRASGDQGRNVYLNITENLFNFNSDWEMEPWLVKEWEQVDDLEWVFYLQEDVKFSNGEPFTAEVVGWNLDRGGDTEYPRTSFDYTSYMEKWEAVDEHTLKIYTQEPTADFPLSLSDIPMLEPNHSDEIGEEAIGSDIVGTGPYVLDSWDKKQKITLKANEDYWQGRPNIDKYVIKAIPEQSTRTAEFLNGEVDLIEDLNDESINVVKKREGSKVDSRLETRVMFINFNTLSWSPNREELQDTKVRKALNYAVDKENIIDNVLGGYGKQLATWYREDFPSYDASIEGFEYNPEKAKELLKEAGYEDGFEVKLQSNTLSSSKGHEIDQLVCNDLSKVGINCEVIIVEDGAMRDIAIGGQDSEKAEGLFNLSWASKPGMVVSWMDGIIKPGGLETFSDIEGYEDIYEKVIQSNSDEEYKKHLAKFQQMLVDDPPFLYLPQLENTFALSDRLDWSPSDHYYTLAYDMDVEE